MNYYELSLHRKKEIEESLLTLMQQIPFREITVKDLAEQMHFVRKTFYHYFPNKLTCLESLADRLILECNLKVAQEVPEDAGLYRITLQRIWYWIGQKDFLEAVNRNGLGGFLAERFLLYIHREDPYMRNFVNAVGEAPDEDILFFYVSGQVCLLLKWCAEGFPLTPEEMAAKSLQLLHSPFPPHAKK